MLSNATSASFADFSRLPKDASSPFFAPLVEASSPPNILPKMYSLLLLVPERAREGLPFDTMRPRDGRTDNRCWLMTVGEKAFDAVSSAARVSAAANVIEERMMGRDNRLLQCTVGFTCSSRRILRPVMVAIKCGCLSCRRRGMKHICLYLFSRCFWPLVGPRPLISDL